MRALLRRLHEWLVLARLRAQRRDLRARLFRAWARLDELQRIHAAYSRELVRRDRQLVELRARIGELEDLLRAIRPGVQVLAAEEAAHRAREAAASGFGGL